MPPSQQGIDAISRNALAQAQLIDDLLDMSRIISGKLRLESKPVSMADVVEAAIDAVMPSASAKGIAVRKSVDPSAGAVTGDATRLQQVVWNLMTNAVKFTRAGGEIAVGLRREGLRVEITVRDDGAGIAPEFLPFLFERFRQADSSASRRHGGLGIGLTLVRQLVELHGGSVRAFSEGVGRGATFTVTLPSSTEAAPPAAGRGFQPMPESPVEPNALRGVRVLYVDDDADSRRLAERILADRGAEVVLAASSPEALGLLRDRRPDVLVSDIGLPEVDGYELMRRIRDLPEDEGGRTPAAALTAFARPEDRQKALQAGYQSHIAKPVIAGEFIAVVADLAPREPRPRS